VPVADGERSHRIALWLSTAGAAVVLLVGLAKAAPVVAVVVLAATAWVLAFVLLTSSTAPGKTNVGREAVRPRSRAIPQWVKIAVATRDGGKCRSCGSYYDLQYDHIVPYSLGGSSTDVNNIQLLCGRCNRLKSNRYVG
jgi:hypothetical protein